MARWFVIAGIILIVVGAILHFAPGVLNWFGKLPGDINIRSEGSRVFIPITSMIILSVVLTIVLNLFNR
jgi:H+/Cl- antiporter ClcA